ncbi:ABC transporter substrate-binding protein [Alkalinema pantanalense CENA528]|uniref:ABC transporter substrate-binding protein n=1 Tax=Alkalinema pantanalense TaxID=1620705 RepID=UPI003D6EB6F8
MVGLFRRKTWRWVALWATIALCLSLQLAACSPANFKSQAARVPELIISQTSNPKTFNYALSNESPNVFGYLYEGLINENTLTGELEPIQAESWEVSPDKKRVIVTLRPDLKWSDGQPLTADDVVFSFRDVYFNPDIPTDIQDVLKIGKDRKLPTIRKIDDRRVEFTTPEPFAPFLRQLGLAILPKHVLEATVREKVDGKPKFLSTWTTETDPKQIVCNGMYVLDSYTPNQRVIFKRNPNYWRKDQKNQQQPYIERIVWKSVENQNTELQQFRSGGPDLVEPIRPEDFALLKQEEKRGKFTLYMGGPRQIFTFVAFNLNQGKRNGKPLVDPVKSKWFNNVKFRQAVAYALDLDRMNTNLFRGLGSRVHSSIVQQSPFYLPPEKGLKTYNYNPERARQILQSAGFKYTSDNKLVDADGNPVKFTITTNASNVLRVQMISQIKQDLAQIGMEVALSAIDFNVLSDKVDNSMDWDAVLMAYGGGGLDPHGGSNMWLTDGRSHLFNQKPGPSAPPVEGRVVSDWEKEIEQLYIKGAQELDETKRKQIYNQFQQIAQEQVPFIYLVNARIMAAVRDRIKGVRYPEGGEALWNLHELKVED